MPLACPNCGKNLPDNVQFCSECGTTVAVQEKKPDYCANCFAELPENAKFCLQCGKPAVIAHYPLRLPARDEAIYEELFKTSPQQVKYRERKAAYQATGEYPHTDDDIEDFEQNKAIIALRARKWAECETKGMERIHWFQEFLYHFALLQKLESLTFDIFEKSLFPTNKPNHHKALFMEKIYNYYLYQFRHQGVLTWNDPPQPTPLFFEYLKKVVGYTDEDTKQFRVELPDIEEIRGWAAKDD